MFFHSNYKCAQLAYQNWEGITSDFSECSNLKDNCLGLAVKFR